MQLHSRAASTPKAELRRQFLAARLALEPEVWQRNSANLCAQLQAWPVFGKARTILAYVSFRNEPDLSSLWQVATGQVWAFPRCVGQELSWHQRPAGGAFRPGRYGILEPDPSWPRQEPGQADLLLIPALACDRRGYRLGYGGGFYDRLLARLGRTELVTAGIVFQEAWVDTLPTDPWDQTLKVIGTDVAVLTV